MTKTAHDKIAVGLSDPIAGRHDTTTRERVARAMFDAEWDISGAEVEFAGQREIHWRIARPRRLQLAVAAIASMPGATDAPQDEVTVFAADGSRTVEMRSVSLTAKGQRCCTICKSPLDMPGRPWTQDCGGDCLACMAEVGDPDCVAAMPGVVPEELVRLSAEATQDWVFATDRGERPPIVVGSPHPGTVADSDIVLLAHYTDRPPAEEEANLRLAHAAVQWVRSLIPTHPANLSPATEDIPHACLIEDPHPAFTAAMMADLTAMPPAVPGEAVGGQNEIGRCTIHSGGRDVPQRAPDAISEALSVLTDPDDPTLDAVETIYAAVQRAMAAAGPLPLASAEPWEESDVAYRTRLSRICGPIAFMYLPSLLDPAGSVLGLPRARLVPVER